MRTAAAAWSRRDEGRAALPALIAGYRGWEGDSTYVARAAALGAAARIDPTAARPVLEDALKDREWEIRMRAAMLLREQGVPRCRPRTARHRWPPARAGRVGDAAQPEVFAACLHRHRPRHDRDRARHPGRAAHGGQLHCARAKGVLQRYRGPSPGVQTSCCSTATRAVTARAAPATPSATKSTSVPTSAARSAWRSTGKTPAAVSTFITHSPQPHLDDPLYRVRLRRERDGDRRSGAAMGRGKAHPDLGWDLAAVILRRLGSRQNRKIDDCLLQNRK